MPVLPKVTDMITELIATPSMSSTLPDYDLSNLDVISKLAAWLDELGFEISIKGIDGTPGKHNLIATLGSGNRGLILSGHTDTVPMDTALWNSDPFRLTAVSDRWYGLGTSDMKSFFALILEAISPYKKHQFAHPLTILATADEESSMSGIRALESEDVEHAAYAVIGEPTSLCPINRHKGIMMLKADIAGRSGHSSNPGLGANALDASAVVINELITFRDQLRARYDDARFEVNYPTMNLGCIHGGNNPNRICDQVSISLDVRILPGMDNHRVFQELTECLDRLPLDAGLSCHVSLHHDPIPPFANNDPDLLNTLESLTKSSSCSVAFATEAPFLSELGIETVVLGPGSIDQAHQPNEYIELNQLQPTIDIIRALVEKYCLKQ